MEGKEEKVLHAGTEYSPVILFLCKLCKLDEDVIIFPVLNSWYLWTLQCCFPLSRKNLLCFPECRGFILSPVFNFAKLGCKLKHEILKPNFRDRFPTSKEMEREHGGAVGNSVFLVQSCIFWDVQQLKQAAQGSDGFLDSPALEVLQKLCECGTWGYYLVANVGWWLGLTLEVFSSLKDSVVPWNEALVSLPKTGNAAVASCPLGAHLMFLFLTVKYFLDFLPK